MTTVDHLISAIDSVIDTCLQQLMIDNIQQIPFSIPRLRTDVFELYRMREELMNRDVSVSRLSELTEHYEKIAENMNYPYQ